LNKDYKKYISPKTANDLINNDLYKKQLEKYYSDEITISGFIIIIMGILGIKKVWLADQVGINYKSLIDKLKNDTLSGYELLKIANILKINLEQLKNKY
jgi:small basic protein